MQWTAPSSHGSGPTQGRSSRAWTGEPSGLGPAPSWIDWAGIQHRQGRVVSKQPGRGEDMRGKPRLQPVPGEFLLCLRIALIS